MAKLTMQMTGGLATIRAIVFAPSLVWFMAIGLLGLVCAIPTMTIAADSDAGSDTGESGALASDDQSETPLPLYLVDILVFSHKDSDVQAEYWQTNTTQLTSVAQIFHPRTISVSAPHNYTPLAEAIQNALTDFSQQAQSLPTMKLSTQETPADQSLSYANHLLVLSKEGLAKTSFLTTPIDGVMAKLATAEFLARRQWIFTRMAYPQSPNIRINDFLVYGRYPAPEQASDGSNTEDTLGYSPDGSGKRSASSTERARQPLARCEQNRQRQIIFPEPGIEAVEDRPSADKALDVRQIFSAETPTQDSELTQSTAQQWGVVELRAKDYQIRQRDLYDPLYTDIDFSSDKTNRLDGYIKFFYSRFSHIEMRLQFLQPYWDEVEIDKMTQATDRRPANQPACLLAFNLQEDRRFKENETHYFDHPMFSVVLHFKRMNQDLTPKVEQSEPGTP